MPATVKKINNKNKVLKFTVMLVIQVVGLTSTTFSQLASEKLATGQKMAVVCASPYASVDAMYMLKHGGNAFDAAITAQLVLAVVYPQAGNIGGGGFMIAHQKNGNNICLDFREVAPMHAKKDMYVDASGKLQPQLSKEGHLSCGVPGTIAGIFELYKYAKLPFSTLIAPAIEYARDGFPITERMANELNATQAEFLRNNLKPTVFTYHSEWKVGDILIQPALAKTLELIRDKGQKGFYRGKTAKLIVAEMKKGGGIITKRDLKKYKAIYRTPLTFDYKGHQLVTMPLPSSGGIILQQLFQMTSYIGMDNLRFQEPKAIQLVVEAERRAFADRSTYMGDPAFIKNNPMRLLDEKYLKKRMQDFVFGKAGSSNVTGEGNPYESEETTHISIVDEEDNAVSLTTTLNGNFGSKTVVSGAGFLLNNEMDDFSIQAGVPNMYGVTGGDANSIAPRKKMLSSMTPTIVLKEGSPEIVVGTPGGSTIPTSVYQTLSALIDFNKTPQEAVNAKKYHHQWTPDKIFVEEGFPSSTTIDLQRMGYRLQQRNPIGRTELIVISVNGKNEKKVVTAVADNRGDDDARTELSD